MTLESELQQFADQSAEMWQLAAEHSPNGYVIIGADGSVVGFNSRSEFIFGWSRAEVFGKKVELLLPERLREAHVKFRTAFFHNPWTREMGQGQKLYGLHRDGREFRVRIKLAPIVVVGVGLRAVAVVVPEEEVGSPVNPVLGSTLEGGDADGGR